MSSIPRVSPREAHDLIERGHTHVDVRTQREFAEGHSKGALNVPLNLSTPNGTAPNARFLEVMRKLFPDKSAPLVLSCRTGNRSLRAANILATDGYTTLVDQRAGFDGAKDAFGRTSEAGWAKEGLPVETGATSGATYTDLLAKIGG